MKHLTLFNLIKFCSIGWKQAREVIYILLKIQQNGYKVILENDALLFDNWQVKSEYNKP